jgi:hypothetical protein
MKMIWIPMFIVFINFNLLYAGTAADQIDTNNATIEDQTDVVNDDSKLQEKDIKIRYMITVIQQHLIFLQKLFNISELEESE